MRLLTPEPYTEPVTSLQLAADSAMLLVSTLDSTIRAMDLEHGQMFQSFVGHKNSSYRSKVCFGVGEATVIMGDEDGKVWSWDVESVRARLSRKLNVTDALLAAGQDHLGAACARSDDSMDSASPEGAADDYRLGRRDGQDMGSGSEEGAEEVSLELERRDREVHTSCSAVLHIPPLCIFTTFCSTRNVAEQSGLGRLKTPAGSLS